MSGPGTASPRIGANYATRLADLRQEFLRPWQGRRGRGALLRPKGLGNGAKWLAAGGRPRVPAGKKQCETLYLKAPTDFDRSVKDPSGGLAIRRRCRVLYGG